MFGLWFSLKVHGLQIGKSLFPPTHYWFLYAVDRYVSWYGGPPRHHYIILRYLCWGGETCIIVPILDIANASVAQKPRNLLTRWDVSSIPVHGIELTKKIYIYAQREEND